MKKLLLLALILAPMTTFAQKFGHLDTQAIIQSLPDFIKVRGELEAEQKIMENEMQEMQAEIEKQAQAYEQTKATLSKTQQEAKEKELQEQYQRLQQTYQDNQQKLQKLQQEKLQPIMTKVQTAIQNVGKAGGYVFIAETAQMLYFSDTLSKDITTEVKAEINKMK